MVERFALEQTFPIRLVVQARILLVTDEDRADYVRELAKRL